MPKLWLKSTVTYSLIWIPCNTLFIIFETSPLVVIGFISTVMAFFCTYFLPIVMTLKIGDYVTKKVVKAVETESISSSSLHRKLINPDINPEDEG